MKVPKFRSPPPHFVNFHAEEASDDRARRALEVLTREASYERIANEK
jgi:hypothetical protein